MKIPELVWPDSGGYDDGLLLSIDAGVVAYLYRGRNAWHSTWVRHWFRNTHLFRDVTSARAGAEQLRERGNVFYVREVPALILRGSHDAVVLCEPGVDAPFAGFRGFNTTPVDTVEGRWIDGVFPGISLRDAVEAFTEHSGNWADARARDERVLTGIVSSDFSFATRHGRLQSLTSFARGSENHLGWSPDDAQTSVDWSATRSIAGQWQNLTKLAMDAAQGRFSLTESLIKYRDVTLTALPRSQWDFKNNLIKISAWQTTQSRLDEWHDANDRCDQIETAIHEAESIWAAAKQARLRPADTSAGMRAQRERVENVEEAVRRLHHDLDVARSVEADRRRAYLAAEEEQRRLERAFGDAIP
ncbi:hypothetical protein [Microbacterium sp. 2MCAF23]|uniref:hypothetical protein n=1 Tax=Microbacterium sp. 2MCAF23 TaxID=3232985 RepID=UPI003F99EFD7